MPILEIGTVFSCRALTKTQFELFVVAPQISALARPGQFVEMKCGDSRLLRRPISICAVKDDLLRFVFEVRGSGTEWLARRKTHDTLDLLGPLGDGVFPLFLDDPRPVLLVGGGIGVPPLYAVALARRAHAVLGFRTGDAMILHADFATACQTVLIATDDGSVGVHGTVGEPVERLLSQNDYCAVLACGPKPMLRAVAELAERHNTPCFVSMEERMGCGVGACLGCACKTKRDGEERFAHVCKDGPVFPASEVVWE